MYNRKTYSHILSIVVTNALIAISGVLAGFVVPKILGLVEFGYYKTFSLYASYGTFFLLGITDGIYLIFAGYSYQNLPKERIRTIFKATLLFQSVIFVLFLSIAIFLLQNLNLFLIIVFVIFNTLIVNTSTFFQIIAQCTQNIRSISLRNIFSFTFTILAVFGLFLIKRFNPSHVTFVTYTVFIISINLFQAIWWVWSYRELVFGKREPFQIIKPQLFELIKLGILMTATASLNAVFLNLDTQFVNIVYPIEEFSIYSFAHSVLILFHTFVASISIVIYPTLKTRDEKLISGYFEKIYTGLTSFVMLCLIAIFPLEYVIRAFLPTYVDSIDILKILFPSLMFSTCTNVILISYYRAYKKVGTLLLLTTMALFISTGLYLLSFLLFKDMEYISLSYFVSSMFYFLILTYYLERSYDIKWFKNFITILLVCSIYYVSVFNFSGLYSFDIIFSSSIIILFLMHRAKLTTMIKRIREIL